MFDPNTGETPLDALTATDWATYVSQKTGNTPTPGYEGGGQISQKFAAQNDFFKMFGRQPTASELAMLSPAYGGDKNNLNQGAGQAAVAQYFNAFANSPQNVAANQQKKLLADAPKFYDQINGLFQSSLGRDATQAEKEHFGSIMAQGTTDTYALQQFLGSLPEAVQKQDAAFRTSLNDTLQSQDSQYYKEQVLPAIQAQATKQGRSLEASGVNNSLALAATAQNRQREGFLTNITASQYEGSKSLAQDAYARAYGMSNTSADTTSARLDANSAAMYGRNNALNDYNIQKQAYDQYLQRYGKRQGGGIAGAAAGATSGALAGSYFGPWGAAAGGLVGAGIGYFA